MIGRRIAFDYGLARIGVAVCDRDGILTTPLDAITPKNSHKKIAELIAEYQPVALFVGKPVHLSGASSESTERAEEFAQGLETFGLPVIRIDERFTTKSAASQLAEAGYSAKEAKGKIDSASAVAILEQGLAMEKK